MASDYMCKTCGIGMILPSGRCDHCDTPECPSRCYPSLSQLADEIREINRGNGWNVTKPEEWADTYKVPGIIALIHSEASEALEAFRKDDGKNFVEEMADILIRVLDCVAAFEDDFDSVVRAKMEKNRQRGFRHGGKRV